MATIRNPFFQETCLLEMPAPTKRKREVVRWAWVALALLALAVWACTEPAAQGAAQQRKPLKTAEATDEKPLTVTEKETVQVIITSTPTPIPEGGFVTRTTYADAQTPNPILAADEGSLLLCELMFEGMLRVDPFTGEWIPNLADKWTVSDDGLTYTFHLRRGLQWSDGEPITAHDFYFSYAALLSGVLHTPNAEAITNIEQIEVVDDHAVAVTFAQVGCGNLDSLRFGWLPMHVFTDDILSYDWNELVRHESNSRPTVFSGPFMLQEWVRGDHWTQVRNERYWRGAPHLDGIVTRVVRGQDEMIDLLQEGQVDIGAGFDPQHLAQVEQWADLAIYKFLSDEYDFIGFQLGDPGNPQPRLNQDGTVNEGHGRHPILQDPRVRQAIVHALDREEIIAQARLGQGVLLHANVLPLVSWAYNTDLGGRAHDVERAKALLEEAGWTLNPASTEDQGRGGVRSKDGLPLRLTLYTNAGNVVRETTAELVRAQLAEVGIEVEVLALDWYALLDVLYGQTFDMVLTSWSNLGVDPHDEHLWRAASDVPGVGSNFVSYHNPAVEALYAEVRALPGCDQDVRRTIYRQVQAALYEDQPYCWLDVPRKFLAVRERVGGMNPGPWSVWHNVHEWYVQE
jgi:peptide/nickel transport system substrate-binding protein